MNLLKETIEKLRKHNKEPKDVLYCGTPDFGYFTWEDFEKVADIEYDEGFGGQRVAEDLIIVGNGFWLERHEYDGSEWWEYKAIIAKPEKYNKPKRLVNKEYFGCPRLKEMNKT